MNTFVDQIDSLYFFFVRNNRQAVDNLSRARALLCKPSLSMWSLLLHPSIDQSVNKITSTDFLLKKVEEKRKTNRWYVQVLQAFISSFFLIYSFLSKYTRRNIRERKTDLYKSNRNYSCSERKKKKESNVVLHLGIQTRYGAWVYPS